MKSSMSSRHPGGAVFTTIGPVRSSLCSAEGCIEVEEVAAGDLPADLRAKAPKAADEDRVFVVSDSKGPAGPKLVFYKSEWDAFLGGVRNGEFDFAAAPAV